MKNVESVNLCDNYLEKPTDKLGDHGLNCPSHHCNWGHYATDGSPADAHCEGPLAPVPSGHPTPWNLSENVPTEESREQSPFLLTGDLVQHSTVLGPSKSDWQIHSQSKEVSKTQETQYRQNIPANEIIRKSQKEAKLARIAPEYKIDFNVYFKAKLKLFVQITSITDRKGASSPLQACVLQSTS